MIVFAIISTRLVYLGSLPDVNHPTTSKIRYSTDNETGNTRQTYVSAVSVK